MRRCAVDGGPICLGGTGDGFDLSSPAASAYVKGLNGKANRYWNSLTQIGCCQGRVFSDLDMTDGVSGTYTRSGNMGDTLQRLAVLSMAWATRGCDLYHDGGVLNGIIKAADYVAGHFFQKGRFTNRSAYGNWYHWEITCPTALGSIAMVLYDQLGADRVRLYAEAIQYHAPYCTQGGPNSDGPAMTGGNLLLKANGVAQAGILLEDASMLENVRAGVKGAIVYNGPGRLFALGGGEDGFYADGSYIQHQRLPYIAGYGADFYRNYGMFALTLRGTDWDVTPSEGEAALICDFVFHGIEPFLAGTRTMDMVAGRDVTRSGRSDRKRTANILCALLSLRGTFPTAEQNQRFDRMMKFFLSRDPDGYYSRMDSITPVRIAGELMADCSVKPRSGYALTKTFAMDRTVHHTSGFTLGIPLPPSMWTMA